MVLASTRAMPTPGLRDLSSGRLVRLELLFLSRAVQRGKRTVAAGDDFIDLVEVTHAHFALMLGCGIAKFLVGEFFHIEWFSAWNPASVMNWNL